MTIDSQKSANLAAHGYEVEVDVKKGQMQQFANKEVNLEGVTYKVRAYMDKPSGYQGAIYRRMDTSGMVVVHRGTRFDREPIEGGAASDHFSAVRMHASKYDVALARSASVHRAHHSSFQEA